MLSNMTNSFPWLTNFDLHSPDAEVGYPLLAMRIIYSKPLQKRTDFSPSVFGSTYFERKQMYSKCMYFLTADRDGNFIWVACRNTSLFRPGLTAYSNIGRHQRTIRYSIEEGIKKEMSMIYPVRPFSITGVDLEGFDSEKSYPVLAIDVDRFLPEENADDGEMSGVQSETMAFFLVGDDGGEFAWVAEDECKLAPLT